MTNVRAYRLLVLSILTWALLSCSASGPKTQYYSLFADHGVDGKFSLADKNLTFGIGPINLPEYLDSVALVSLSGEQRLKISGRYAWAGSLEDAIPRVLADELSSLWGVDGVWGFPWDNRVRPEYQVRMVFEKFIGERGGEVVLQVKWRLLNKKGRKVLLLKKETFKMQTQSELPEDYVAALNTMLMRLSESIAEDVYLYLKEI